mmetsp:Transcript_2134/g.3194  ORF Transcript_2134/g.3194 Transcript_2134/m.3194 type:complete len:83 (+) Transcript_2134:265-513(+)|eukprot:CAMPEP_0170489000 /NCGR_PEP_ID=MMETSP0208-20121228/7424_1 /TAXON_ID=197538 /ORGANISM="Strombidium inclinatum, Strain S3" /LENGTH=82 /DNA_ID=CAMNT_0010763743 /DNA_START=269 /DNA_END=517 /DNA_ORIENTATION=-
MGTVVKKEKKEKKVKILKPVAEESTEAVCHSTYKGVFKRVHQDLKEMRTGPKRNGAFFKALPKLRYVISSVAIRKMEQGFEC